MAIDRKVQAIFDKAMYLIDAQNEATGSTDNPDTVEYKVRTVGILNTLLDEVYPASDTFEITEEGKRPALDDIVSFEDEVDLDARILREVLPNGLAARLLSEENPALANFFEQKYEEALMMARAAIPTSFESIGTGEDTLPYGGIEYGQFSRW